MVDSLFVFMPHISDLKLTDMNKIILLAIVVCIAGAAHAQIGKGSILLGGNFGFNTSKVANQGNNDESKSRGLVVSPAIGTAVKENLIAGIGLYYGRYTNKGLSQNSFQSNSKSNFTGGFIFIRKYRSLGKGFYLFGQPALYYNEQLNRTTYIAPNSLSVTSNENKSAGLSFYPGVSYAINKSIQLEVGLNQLINIGFNQEIAIGQGPNTTQQTTKTNSFNFSTSIGPTMPLSIGVRVLLAK